MNDIALCCIGSHSALDVAAGARAQGLQNLIITARGREKTYAQYFRRVAESPARGCVDEVIELDDFTEIVEPRVQEMLLARNAIFVPNRSFEVYLRRRYTYDEIERLMRVPFFGNRRLLRAEERDEGENQYALLRRAKIAHPRQFSSPEEIDRLVMVKASHARITFERAFFLCSSPQEYRATAARLIEEGSLSEESLASAVMEEYLLGPSINLNFFYSPMLRELELLGTDTRRQTNLEGFRNVPPSAYEAVRRIPMSLEEAGHIAATMTESMLEAAFAMGEAFVAAASEAMPPGVIGPFALQCAIVAGPPKALVCYDVSLRVPGSPGTRFTPYSSYRWGRDVSVGERIAMEVVMARDAESLGVVLT